ncbi:hypothetical protein FGRMN_2230 [Fusarium graminum]|nr:hypothetical protein FGRMN_2230 [Fusarium graminum]
MPLSLHYSTALSLTLSASCITQHLKSNFPRPITNNHIRGEQAATALENNLSNLESRLDAILAALEAKEDSQPPATVTGSRDEPQDSINSDTTKDSKDAA